MRILILFFLGFFFPNGLFSKVHFQSDFEEGTLFISEVIKPHQESFSVFPGKALSEWPAQNGKGIIYLHPNSKAVEFKYEKIKGNKFLGVIGLEKHFPKFSIISFGSCGDWLEKTAVIHAVQKQKYSHDFHAAIQSPEPGFSALTQPLAQLTSLWAGFEVRFSGSFLKTETPRRFHQLLGDDSHWEFVQLDIWDRNQEPKLCLLARFGNEQDTLYSQLPLNSDSSFSILYCYLNEPSPNPLGENSIQVKFWVNGILADSILVRGKKKSFSNNPFSFSIGETNPLFY